MPHLQVGLSIAGAVDPPLTRDEIRRQPGLADLTIATIVFDGMPVQDAVNFAAFIVRTTIGMATFEAGSPTCGGPLQVATIFQETGFEWVLEPAIAVFEP